jgi:hypothetical protein
VRRVRQELPVPWLERRPLEEAELARRDYLEAAD